MFNRARALLGAAIAWALQGTGFYVPAPYLTATGKSQTASRASRNTVARDKRTALKRRNHLRHKRAVRRCA